MLPVDLHVAEIVIGILHENIAGQIVENIPEHEVRILDFRPAGLDVGHIADDAGAAAVPVRRAPDPHLKISAAAGTVGAVFEKNFLSFSAEQLRPSGKERSDIFGNEPLFDRNRRTVPERPEPLGARRFERTAAGVAAERHNADRIAGILQNPAPALPALGENGRRIFPPGGNAHCENGRNSAGDGAGTGGKHDSRPSGRGNESGQTAAEQRRRR